MKRRFSYQHIALALLATLVLAGLFSLPYFAVRNKTIETFRAQQSILARQAGAGMQTYFATYEKALTYLVQQPSIQRLEMSGTLLLRDFLSIHPDDLLGIQRIDATGVLLAAVPEDLPVDATTLGDLCRQLGARPAPAISEVFRFAGSEERIFFSAAVLQGDRFEGCLALVLPFARIAARHLGRIPVHQGGYALLIDQQGRLLHAPAPERIGGGSAHLRGEPEELAQLRAAMSAREPAIVALTRDLLDDSEASARAVYAVVVPLELPGGAHWSIVLTAPAAEVLGAMATFRSQWLAVTAVAVVAVGLLSLFLSGIVSKQREEQRRRAAEEQLAALLDLAPMGVFLLDAEAMVVYANQEAARMAADSGAERVSGQPFGAFFQEECRAALAGLIREPASDRAAGVKATQLLHSSGTLRELLVTATPCRLGMHHQTIAVVRDVTEERKAEAWRRRLAAAIDQVKEAVLIADREGMIEYVNAALGEMSGYARAECLGRPVRMLWAREQDAHFDQKLADVVRLGEVWRGRIVNQRRDGSLFVAAATVSPVRDTDGGVTHFVAVQRDITHEVEIEARMRQAQKMEAIGTLAGGIAHDFNNILGGIIGFTDMALLQSTPETELHNNLLHIRQGGKRAADLVQQILTFSRQSAEEKVPVPVAPLIQESLKLMRATLPATIDITQDLVASDALVMAAPVQIQQIVMNLCANAFYAMRDHGGHLTIRLARANAAECGKAETEHGWAALVVEDTGQGIESENLQRIFTPFFTTKQTGEGTGMGLSVVHGIVRELGGEISVQSQPGEGTVFTVLLPLVEQDGNGSLVSSEEPLPVGTEHILVVDDEKEIRETCRMMLRHLGYTITTTGNPLETFALIEQANPPVDLVITDQTMPKMTGVALTQELRRRYSDLPVMLCTGYSDRLNYDIAREAGACDLLMKPVDLRGLGTAVRAALAMRA